MTFYTFPLLFRDFWLYIVISVFTSAVATLDIQVLYSILVESSIYLTLENILVETKMDSDQLQKQKTLNG